ncbi:E3 ubiquitin-protein ligase SlrP-like [Chrysoperla carnea]|uniref:E3 ubiquitin-protein ligase SlrP-like n=1 Tax=Chrysoperla carnea TaxID=189513 RepID=UPI001D084341|nr:E3 ubiquitin-protein ligase SlrP-like [Chrysoperla carnea]
MPDTMIEYYIEKWTIWSEQEKYNKKIELRDLATKKLVEYFDINSNTLCLTNMNLTNLPNYLPNTLQQLNISGNCLQILPNALPPLLEELNVTDNKLQTLPENLPNSLQRLIVMENCIQYLPNNLPESLQQLDLSFNALKSLPNTAQPFRSNFITLQELDLSHNQFEHIPENLPYSLRILNMSHNCIEILPNQLPHSLRQLDISDNKITVLPDNLLPNSLWLLNISGNNIKQLPNQLPNALRQFDCAYNSIRILPTTLPNSIQELNISGNYLECLPNQLPSSLQRLNAHRNDLNIFPNNLPQSLITINLADNLLCNWPEKLPLALEILDVSYNDFISLPNNLPNSIKELHAQHNFIRRLPISLPNCMRFINLSDNQLTQLSSAIEGLSTNTNINIENNPLSLETIDMINRLFNDSSNNRRLPTIFFNTVFIPENNSNTIVAAIRPLYEEIHEWGPGIEFDDNWRQISEEPTAKSFSYFLYKLRQTINYENDEFKNEIIKWLNQLADLKLQLLRQKIFQIAEEATQSCEDRVTWCFNQMKILNIAWDVETGKYDQQIEQLLQLARGMYRLNVLEDIARFKVQSLNFVDEIEVYLAYQVKLYTILELPIQTPDMRFWTVAWLTQNDLDNAVQIVQNKEKENFSNYLLLDWQPWKEVLKRWNIEAFIEAEKQINNEQVFKEQFDERKQKYLLETNLLDVELDVETQLGQLVRRNIERDVWYQLTKQFLNHSKSFIQIDDF